MWCVGDGMYGVLGDGTNNSQASLTQMGTEADWASVSFGEKSACGRKADGSVWCWGIADGRTGRPAMFSDMPVEVTLP